ncbi:MAG: uncharacterized protein JWR28_3327 [Modestobacter sp.]|nr:uncharacterized protein [Modestobacter sp.]
MLIDCDTCTVRGQGCDDCVVTVLLGAPPGWRGSDPTVVPLTRRGAAAAQTDVLTDDAAEASGDAPGCTAVGGDVPRIDSAAADPRPVVELDDVERRAVRALAEFGLVPPLRHQDASTTGDRHVS